MSGESASQMIFFIAAMIVSTSIAGVFMGTVIKLSGDIQSRGNALSAEINTAVSIINDPAAMPYNSTALTLDLYVKNMGSTSLTVNSTRVLVDGNYSSSNNLTFELQDGATSWNNEAVLKIIVGNCTLSPGDHRVKVIVTHGKFTTLDFKI